MQPAYPQAPQGYPQQQQQQYAPQQGGQMVPQGGYGLAAGPFAHTNYSVKRPFWSFLGREYKIFAPDGSLVVYVKHPLMKLRAEFTFYADEAQTQPILVIRARQIIGLNIANDVFDAQTGQKLGSIRSRGLKSIIRDTWDLLDPNDNVVGLCQEDGAALLRRFIPMMLGKWHVELGGQECAKVKQKFKFFSKEFDLDLSMNQGRLDPKFAMACAIMCLMAESRREDSK